MPKPDLTRLTMTVARMWLSMRPMVWGPLLTVVGLVAVVLGLAVSLALSVAGIAVAAAGLGFLARVVAVRVEMLREEQTRLKAGSSSD